MVKKSVFSSFKFWTNNQSGAKLSLIIIFYCRKQLIIYLQHCIRGANATKLFVGQNLKLNK